MGKKCALTNDWDEVDRAWKTYINFPQRDRRDSIVETGEYALQLPVKWMHYNKDERGDQFLIMQPEGLLPYASSGMIDLKPFTDSLCVSEMSVNGSK